MRPDELRAALRLGARTLGETVSHVEQVHQAVATRAFSLTAPVSLPVRVVHNGIAARVYAAIRGAGHALGVGASELAAALAGSEHPAGSTPRGNLAQAVLNSVQGDELARAGSPLAITMAVRHGRRDLAPRAEAFADAFPQPSGQLAVFLHGLAETEESWQLHADRDGRADAYGVRLEGDFGYTPVYVRYNTGLHISENGQHLDSLLDTVVAAWPVEVEELILVGHSMGGLVARSACYYAERRAAPWVSMVRHAFYLGSPHTGAGLERWVSSLSGMLDKLEESRPFASFLDRRSAGIKDLRAGCLLDEDWRGALAGEEPRRSDVPLIPSADHYTVSASLTTSRHHPLARVVGDLLVQPASAHGQAPDGRHIPIPAEHQRHFGGLHHFRLLHDPSVYEAIRQWLEPAVVGPVEQPRGSLTG